MTLPVAAPAAIEALTLVVNARASGAPPDLAPLRRQLGAEGADVDVVVTHSVEDLAAVRRERAGQRLVLVGGDGTVHAAANLPGGAGEVALIAAGRANNIARSLGIPLDPAHAARLAATGVVRPVDLIEAQTQHRRYVVVEGLSAGFLAQARAGYHADNSADVMAAVRAGVAALAHFRPLRVTVTHGAVTEHLELAQLFVANLPLYAFGLRVAPHADPTDAMLDVVGVEEHGRSALLRMLLALHHSGPGAIDGVHCWRARRVTLASDGCTPIIGDSANLGSGPVALAPLPAALRLVRP